LDEIRSLGAELVAVTQSKPEVVAVAVREQPWPHPLLCDPDRAAFRAFGLERGSWGMFFRPHVLGHYLRRMWRGWWPRAPKAGEDLLQLGGDFILDSDGQLVFAHRSADPSDRPGVDELRRRQAAIQSLHQSNDFKESQP
jgi:hypothetical protein